ncbi:hypothetical protein HYPSUDRAFT_1046480 [Hypholoma sublateritium FD-334 SS-4]|uniref:Uncharacterized protein n=1 Tax=Hypholoma sublateritium (strain FD-334 SS-4) TaxID=945553 RepID=A0A0D2NKB4_HYPSF|nr:hypothetical protein HYPSUDRAFT_1046480 [Hypholoma sublateritium FD-334 SS-4]
MWLPGGVEDYPQSAFVMRGCTDEWDDCECATFLDMEIANAYVALSSLGSVVDCKQGDMRVPRASLLDFLLDKMLQEIQSFRLSECSTRLSGYLSSLEHCMGIEIILYQIISLRSTYIL